MSAKTSGIPRYRSFDGPVLLRQGFRSFFLGAGLWAFFGDLPEIAGRPPSTRSLPWRQRLASSPLS